jgi:hypothetical protein
MMKYVSNAKHPLVLVRLATESDPRLRRVTQS